MGSPRGLVKADWSGTLQGWLLRGIIQIYYNRGHRKKTIGECLRHHVPRDVYVPIIGVDVNDNAIENRGHKGVLLKNAFEHPDKHPMGMKMLPFANTIVEQDLTVTREQIDQIVQEALSTEQTIDIKKVIVDDELNKTIGLIYIGGTGTENCLFGMTSKKDAMERVKAFLKGDVDNHMAIRHVMWLADVKSVDITLKNRFRGEHLGEERYQVPADTIWHYVKLEANRRQIAHYTVVEDGRRISIEM